MGVTQRKAKDRELKRLTEAKEVLRKCKCLPGSRTRKAAVARVCAPAKASWGWLFRRPTHAESNAFFQGAKALHQWPKQSAVPLLQIFSGHWWDLGFAATVTTLRVLTRYVHKTQMQLQNWPPKMSGWTGSFRKGMQELGFAEAGSWTWTHPMLETIQIQPTTLPEKATEVLSHRLRDAWRIRKYEEFLELDRRDSTVYADIPCDLSRINILRRKKLNSHELAVVTGAFISPQCRNAMGGAEETCPYCQHVCATVHHMLWECTQNPHRDSTIRPHDVLQERLAWPTTDPTKVDQDHDNKLLRFAAATRADVLQQRHDAD